MSVAKNLLAIVVFSYCAIMLGMYVIQRQLMYHPENKGLAPEVAGLSGVQVLELSTADGQKIVAWYSAPQERKPVVLYFHGNAGEIGDRPLRFRFYQSRGFGVFYLSYRGYGGSSGSPTETGLIADAEAGYAWLLQNGLPATRIVLVGESLGSGVAVQLAARHPVAAVALEAPYTSTTDIAAETYWWLPVRYLMKDRFESIARIAGINTPLLVIHGDADTLIPIRFGRKLFEAAMEPKSFIAWPGRGHEAIFDEDTWKAEVEFFQTHAG
jgi:hypothetical protein